MSLEFTGGHRSRQAEDTTSVSLAPLIDMIFILLIFFLVTASFTQTSGLDISRPEASTGSALDESLPTVTVRPDQTITILDEPVELNAIASRLRRTMDQLRSRRVVIAADKQVQTERLVRVIDECKKAGAEQISIATRKTK